MKVTTASSCIQVNMYQASSVLLLASCLSNVLCQTARPPYPPGGPSPPPAQYPTPAPVQDYNPDIGQTNVGGYGVNKDPYCHKVEKVIFKNKCESYTEKTCWTQNEELCEPVMYKNCTGVIETNIERVCFNVNELVCNLVEAVHYETLEETYQVQRCFTGKDRVCDTIYDVTCTNTVEFNCKREKTTKNDGYGQKEVVCTRTPKQDCYNIPRKIQVEVCKTDVHRYCEKFSNIFPFPEEKQNCHFEPKKICELEMKTRPKKAKKYSYTKDCKEQPREICDQCEKKTIQRVCEKQERLVCTYEPVETCKDEDKQYCHKVEKVELEEVCDMKFDSRYL